MLSTFLSLESLTVLRYPANSYSLFRAKYHSNLLCRAVASLQCFRYFSFCVLIIQFGLAKFLFSVRHVVVCVVLRPTGRGRFFLVSALGSSGLCDGGSVYHYFLGGHGI